MKAESLQLSAVTIEEASMQPGREEYTVTNSWSRIRARMGRVAAVGITASAALAASFLSSEEAQAATPTCYGDYCSGQYPDATHCDEDATTLAVTTLNKSGGSMSVGAYGVGASSGGDTGDVGVVELRWSERCGTAWGRLRTKRASDITYLGIEKNDGYWQQISTNGQWIGSPAGNWFTPMVYGRDDASQFRAYIYSQEAYDPTPDNFGTYWMNAKDKDKY